MSITERLSSAFEWTKQRRNLACVSLMPLYYRVTLIVTSISWRNYPATMLEIIYITNILYQRRKLSNQKTPWPRQMQTITSVHALSRLKATWVSNILSDSLPQYFTEIPEAGVDIDRNQDLVVDADGIVNTGGTCMATGGGITFVRLWNIWLFF